MNPQPPEHIGNIVALILLLGIAYFAFKEYRSCSTKSSSLSDLFTIGYLEDSQSTINIVNTVHTTKPNFESTQLYNDCIEALHALGMKKSEAKKRAKKIFTISEPNSIQDFLMMALKK